MESSDLSGKLGKLANAANDYYQSGLSETELSEAVDAANNAVNALPEDMQAVINEVIDAAVSAVEQASSDIDAALQTWDTLCRQTGHCRRGEQLRRDGMRSGYTCTMEDAARPNIQARGCQRHREGTPE